MVSTSHAGSPIQIFYLILNKIVSGGGITASVGGGGSYGGSGSVGSVAPAPTTIPTEKAPPEEIPPIIEPPPPGPPPEVPSPAAPVPSASPPIPGENKMPNNPAMVFPSVIGYALVRNVAIVFGVILVAAILVLRWRKGGDES